MSYFSDATYQHEANLMVPDLYRHTTQDDINWTIPEEGGDGFTVRMHESYALDKEAMAESNRVAPHFATEDLAERWAWFWTLEAVDDETEYYSDEAKALLEALEEGEWGLSDDQGGELDAYNEQLGRMMIRLMNAAGEVRWFDTCSEAHAFLCEEDGVLDQMILDTFDRSEIALNEGTYVRYTLN